MFLMSLNAKAPRPHHAETRFTRAFNLAYDFYFAIVIPEAAVGRLIYLTGWFVPNVVWVGVTIYKTKPRERMQVLVTITIETVALLLLYHFTATYVPDQQCRAYRFGVLALFVDTTTAIYQTWKYGTIIVCHMGWCK